MKRYLVVANDGYYPDGMLDNIRGHFDSLDEANKFNSYMKTTFDYSEVVDRDSFEPDSFYFEEYVRKNGK